MEIRLPLSPSWKTTAKERGQEPLPTKLIMPHVREVGEVLLHPVRRLLKSCESTLRIALKDVTQYQELLKDFRRPFMHAITVHEFCSDHKEAPETLREFVHELGELNDSLRQGKKISKERGKEVFSLFEALKDSKQDVFEFDTISQRKFLNKIERRREDLRAQCEQPDRVFTPKEFHSLRYDVRQLMYLHRGGWKAMEEFDHEGDDGDQMARTQHRITGYENFRVFLHLLQLSERMGELNDILIDTKEEEPLFLAPLDREDLIRYLAIPFHKENE